MCSLWSFLLLWTLWISLVNCQDSVEYQNDTITVTEGENVALYCSFNVNNFKGLRWYKVNPGSSPVHIIYAPIKTRVTEGELTLDFQGDSCFLHIQHPAVSDSALYLCAVHANSFGNKLIFGVGTRLHVIPKTQQQTPSVYKLKSKSESVDNLPNSVCLITDFPSPNKTLNIDGEVVDLNVVAVLDNSTNNVWRYSTVIWDNNNEDVACNGKYDDKDFYAKSDTDNTEETCSSSVSIDENFKTNPSLNTISLTVLGWRFFTAKSIVFNLIITARFWS